METSGKSLVQLARDLGVSDSALHSWRKSISTYGNQAFPGKGRQTELEEKIHRLEHENEILRQERDILKSAIAVPLAERHVLIEQVHTAHPESSIRQMCQSLQVNRS